MKLPYACHFVNVNDLTTQLIYKYFLSFSLFHISLSQHRCWCEKAAQTVTHFGFTRTDGIQHGNRIAPSWDHNVPVWRANIYCI